MDDKTHVPTMDELLELPEPGDAQISPDGEFVCYVVRTPDWKENQYRTQIWLVSVEQPAPRQLTFAKQSSHSPRWSPDGQWLAFLSQREGDEHTQIYRLSPFGGEAERLTEMDVDVQSLAWSPDGKSIAFAAPELPSVAMEKREERYGDYHVENEDYVRSQLWLLTLDDSQCRQLTGSGELHVGDYRWHPQGDRIAFSACPTPDAKDWTLGRIYILSLATLEVDPVTGESSSTPRWSPDGTQLAAVRIGDLWYKNSEVCVLPADGGEARVVSSAFDESAQLQDWGPDGIVFVAVQRTAIHLFLLDPESGDTCLLTPEEPAGWVGMNWTFSADYDRAAAVVSDVSCYAEVTVLDLDEGTVRRLTDIDDETSDWLLGQQEVVLWKSADGTPIEGVLTKPADFDPSVQYPLLVVIHGGPSSVSLPAKLYGSRGVYPIHQWAGKGALILQPNYRGSAGYGEAFCSLNVRNLGLGDYEDVISGVDVLIERGWVDPERVGAMGWSQGGYISAFITTYSDRFKAVSVGAGISNWVTYYVNTDIHPFTRIYLESTPWEDAEIYRRTSPMTYIRNAKTPTLIQHGELDRRVPIPNAYELYQGLLDMGVETKLVVYKSMPHGITKPRLRRQAMQENLDWFTRWIWEEAPAVQEPPPCYVALAEGDQDEGTQDLPAIQRCTTPQVQDVYHWARRDRASFRIFSGALGLVAADDPLPPRDHKLQAKRLSDMAVLVAEQLMEQGHRKVVVYTVPAEKSPAVLISVGCLQAAAGIAGKVIIEHRELDGES